MTFLSSHWFSLALRSLCHCYVCTRVYEAELGEGTFFPTVLPPPRPLRPGPLLLLCNELNAAQGQQLTHSPPLTSMNARSELVRSTMAVELAGSTPSCGGKFSAVPPLASYGDEKPFFFYFLERKSVDVRRTGVQ